MALLTYNRMTEDLRISYCLRSCSMRFVRDLLNLSLMLVLMSKCLSVFPALFVPQSSSVSIFCPSPSPVLPSGRCGSHVF